MLDSRLYPRLHKLYFRLLQPLRYSPVQPNHLSAVGFLFGLWAFWEVWQERYWLALVPLLLNRIFDGLDGALARVKQCSRASGGFVDICLDFCIYGLFVLGFALARPERGLGAAFLLFSYYLTGTSFLALSSALSRCRKAPPAAFGHKSLHFVSGLCEGTETILAMFLMLLWPHKFCLIAWIFGALCLLTAGFRVVSGYLLLREGEG